MKRSISPAAILAAAAALSITALAVAEPTITRLTPPSRLFSTGSSSGQITARFLPGQRFDLQATVVPDAGRAITSVAFFVNGHMVSGDVEMVPANVPGAPAGAMVATLRAYSRTQPGIHTLSVAALQDDNQVGAAQGNFQIVKIDNGGPKTKNVIICIGDGMGIAHRTAARIMRHGVTEGKSDGFLAMDTMPYTALAITHSLNSIITDSSPGAACYSSGNKGNNNQHGVFPDDTVEIFDNPRIELIGEYLHRTQGKALGIVTTSDVFDATPASFATHTQNRGAGTGICDQFFDEGTRSGLRVLMGGGRKWFLPAGTPGSVRSASNDYILPQELAEGWGVPAGAIDPQRNLIADFVNAGFYYAPTRTALMAAPGNTSRILGLFSYSNMNVAKDKIDGRRGNPAVVNDYGFPDQPMLPEMTAKAIQALSRNNQGFVLMVEASSIDKQAHNMDSERWILDTIEFDDAIQVALDYAASRNDTLVIVTADHECAGINIIGASRITDAELAVRAQSGGGVAQLRTGVVGTYESARFPRYVMAADGYPVTTDPDFKMLIGYAGNADRYEDWRTDARPQRDSQQPFNTLPPLNTYPSGPTGKDQAGNYLITGQVPGSTAVHTASDIPVSAAGRGASRFSGVMDNTDVFFETMQAVLGGTVEPPGLFRRR